MITTDLRLRYLAVTSALALVAFLAPASAAAPATLRHAAAATTWLRGSVVVGFASERDLRQALNGSHARIVRSVPQLRVAELRGGSPAALAAALATADGIRFVQPLVPRRFFGEPALSPAPVPGGAYEWQFSAIHADRVPAGATVASRTVPVAIIDSGADLTAPDIAAKGPATYNAIVRTGNVRDNVGHGTFVSSLAVGSSTNGEGVAGVAGEAPLIVVKAGDERGPTDLDAASAIAYAVDRGARVINLSFGGPLPSEAELRAVDYALAHDVLVVAAVGNEFQRGNPVEYPAAFLQPPGSNGRGGRGLTVAASTMAGTHAPFSNTGSWLSLAAPGELVFGAVSSTSSPRLFPRIPLPGSKAGLYGYSSGTSFAAPQVAGAAALVRGANTLLSAQQAAEILEQTASGHGAWNPELGFGVIDVAAAVELARATAAVGMRAFKSGTTAHLSWTGDRPALDYRLSVQVDGGREQVLVERTASTEYAYQGGGGHTYTFVVESFDSAGTFIARSAPSTLTLGRVRAALSLSVARTNGSRSVVLIAQLKLRAPDVSAASRLVILERRAAGRWHRVAFGSTDATGRTGWIGSVRRGTTKLRARFSGSADLAPALSRTLTLRIR